MGKKWVRLSGEVNSNNTKLCREDVGGCCLAHGVVRDGEIKRIYPLNQVFFATSELANIPYVRALVEAAREAISQEEGEVKNFYYDGDTLVSRWEDQRVDVDDLRSALKPFEGVSYE